MVTTEETEETVSALPTAAEERKAVPLATGCLDYFPAALAEVARVSKAGNDQHNPGQPMHWARGKSNDHADCLQRHLVDRGTIDTDGMRHSAKLAWRALALLQLELEAEGAPLPRSARVPTTPAVPAPVPAPTGNRCPTCWYAALPASEHPCDRCESYDEWVKGLDDRSSP